MSLLVVRFVDESVAFLPFGALEPIRRDLELSYVQGALLLALYPGIGLLGTGFGVLADRRSRRLLAAAGAFGYAAGLLLFAAGGSFGMLVAAVALMGFAGDAMVRAAEVALVDVVGDGVERAVARVTLLATIGDLVGPAVLGVCLATGLGWRAAFLFAGVGMAAYGALLATQPLPGPHAGRHPPDGGGPDPDHDGDHVRPNDDEDRQRDGRHRDDGILAVLRDRRVLRLGVLSAFLDAFDEPFLAFAIAYLTVSRGQPAAVATLAAGGGVVGGLAASAWAARRDRREVPPTVVPALLAVGVAAILVAPDAVVATAGAACVGGAVDLAWIVLQARTLTLRPGQAGTTSAVVSAVEQIAIAVPLVVGVVADRAGLATALSLYLALALVYGLVGRRDRRRPGPIHSRNETVTDRLS